MCCGIVSMGTFMMATYSYFNQNDLLSNSFPIARWIPIIAILFCYGGFALGLGSIPYMLQVWLKFCTRVDKIN